MLPVNMNAIIVGYAYCVADLLKGGGLYERETHGLAINSLGL